MGIHHGQVLGIKVPVGNKCCLPELMVREVLRKVQHPLGGPVRHGVRKSSRGGLMVLTALRLGNKEGR